MLNLSAAVTLHYPYHIAQKTGLIYETSAFCHILLLFDLFFHARALNHALIHAMIELPSGAKGVSA